MVTVRQNRYSVPVGLVGLRVRARIGASEISIIHDGRWSRSTSASAAASAPAPSSITTSSCSPSSRARWRARWRSPKPASAARWPDCFDELWAAIEQRVGRSEAARQIVDVLLLCREHGPARVELAIRGALAAGAHDGRAVAILARQTQRPSTAGARRRRQAARDRRAASRRSLRLRPVAHARGGRAMTAPKNPATAATEALIEATPPSSSSRPSAAASASSPQTPSANNRPRSPTSPRCWTPNTKNAPNAANAAACSTRASR